MTTIDLRSIRQIDEPDVKYSKALERCRLPEELTDLVERYAPLFPDAYEQGKHLSNEDFLQFRAGLRKERKGEFAGEDFVRRFGAVMLPANMINIGMFASKFGVPFGLAFNRLMEVGVVSIDSGVCEFKQTAR